MLALPPRDRPAPTGWTPPEVKEECHSSESKAEVPIRVTAFRAADVRSATPLGGGVPFGTKPGSPFNFVGDLLKVERARRRIF
jgi:hypothetical protein